MPRRDKKTERRRRQRRKSGLRKGAIVVFVVAVVSTVSLTFFTSISISIPDDAKLATSSRSRTTSSRTTTTTSNTSSSSSNRNSNTSPTIISEKKKKAIPNETLTEPSGITPTATTTTAAVVSATPAAASTTTTTTTADKNPELKHEMSTDGGPQQQQQLISILVDHPKADDDTLAQQQQHFQQVIQPWANVSSCGWIHNHFYSGYRNQIMAFTTFVMWAQQNNCSQMLLHKFRHKDTYGSNRLIEHELLFDVEHWNSYYPDLPRMVSCDSRIHVDYDCQRQRWKNNNRHVENATRPFTWNSRAAVQMKLFAAYIRYSKGRGVYAQPQFRNPVDLLMMRGALRPHPDLQKIIDGSGSSHGSSRGRGSSRSLVVRKSLVGNNQTQNQTTTATTTATAASSSSEYMTLHARVEPDMQRHPICRKQKETNLTKIFQYLEEYWPDPPSLRLFMPINRQFLEQEGLLYHVPPDSATPTADTATTTDHNSKNGGDKGNATTTTTTTTTNWMAVDNLQALNRAVRDGLWGGRVQVFEFGSNALQGTKYESKPSTTGALLNFFIAIHGSPFIGTEISTYSVDLLSHRFYRGHKMNNYKYLPGTGIHQWTDETDKHPPHFGC
jgi:hypothetical protein